MNEILEVDKEGGKLTFLFIPEDRKPGRLVPCKAYKALDGLSIIGSKVYKLVTLAFVHLEYVATHMQYYAVIPV